MSEIQLEHLQDGGVAVVRLAAPERKNALVGDMARDLVRALSAVDSDPDVGALVITGGREAFCAGAHRGLLAAAGTGDVQAEADMQDVYRIFSTIRALEVPTVAAVCGPAVGAGLNLALTCGVRVVGDSAFLRSMFVANDIHPAGGHLRMLRDIGGRALAVRMAVFDEALDGAAAAAAGIALGPYPDTAVEDQAVHLARRAARKPDLARWINRSVADVAGLDDEQAARHEAAAQTLSLRRRARA
jgi:enoyl-CoA hydratase